MLRRASLLLCLAYVIGLAWGHVRLPVAAIRTLADYRDEPTSVHLSASDLSAAQRWHLERALPARPGKEPPFISIHIPWNAWAAARVQTFRFAGSVGAEGLDALYLCIFGAWWRVYTFDHVMAAVQPKQTP